MLQDVRSRGWAAVAPAGGHDPDCTETEFSSKKVSLPSIDGVDQAYVGIVSAPEYLRLITDQSGGIRKSLFYENVRDFQDYNPVNKEIRSTLRDIDKRPRFVVMNNGVTIVAREIIVSSACVPVQAIFRAFPLARWVRL